MHDDEILGEDTPPPRRRTKEFVVVSRAGVPGKVTLWVLVTIIGILATATGLGMTPWATRVAMQELKDQNNMEHGKFRESFIEINTNLKNIIKQQEAMLVELQKPKGKNR